MRRVPAWTVRVNGSGVKAQVVKPKVRIAQWLTKALA
jgi:hypothetical protein